MSNDIRTTAVTIVNRLGLHARPASHLAKMASGFDAQIMLVKNNDEAHAKSILEVLTLASPKGTELIIKAEGRDADQAVRVLKELFESGFGDTEG